MLIAGAPEDPALPGASGAPQAYSQAGRPGETRPPLWIPTLEDKVLQRAVAMLLEGIYEQDFSDDSYGFRVGRSAHQALNRKL
ncbi:reverse transcriptase domain-containing protein [Thiohalomonas denitrificans]|uniref:reverse transcriptase domain-containing protein n=1 Tax=Thiohalomonas denitrificans TaxID=415747 RepID=UPI0026F1653B|nr:reverse transcriptase domain-containing protein [Thiohalomonas denitrificans]